MESNTKACLECGKAVKGRADKKFCDDYCRNAYNNKINSDNSAVVRQVNAILKKNRKLLEDSFKPGEELCKTTKQKLIDKGFQFKYLTHTYTNKKGNVYYFSYEYGYLPLEGDWLLLVKRNEENN